MSSSRVKMQTDVSGRDRRLRKGALWHKMSISVGRLQAHTQFSGGPVTSVITL